ncbi:hypothetical protein ACJU26_01880 [Acidithiobacillus sp. M4-SHS-6]|uniref:hypothetical protein n=1 Tax=Acidithiobacillus sp. M4-SHS-6 TaxID=3383024 RepID=UPI0039BE70D9
MTISLWKCSSVTLLGIFISITLTGGAAAKSVGDLPYTGVMECGTTPAQYQALRPAEKVICNAVDATPDDYYGISAHMIQYDMFVTSSYGHLLSDLPMDSPAQAQVIAEQKRYLEQRDACGKNYQCILQTEKKRLAELNAQRKPLERPLPTDEIERLTQGWRMATGKSLTERLLDGFDISPLRRVTFANGQQLIWGFQPDAAPIQSAAVLSPQGKTLALATSDGIFRSRLGQQPGDKGTLRVYVSDRQHSDSVLPLFLSWAAASSLGFNQSCQGQSRHKCEAALKDPPSLAIYDLHCQARRSNASCALPLQGNQAKAQDIGLFWN